jgi:hypothetical protein
MRSARADAEKAIARAKRENAFMRAAREIEEAVVMTSRL